MLKLLIINLLMLITFLAKAQEVVELTDDFQKKGSLSFPQKALVFVDSTGGKSFSEIQKETFIPLVNSSFSKPVRADNRHTFWLKFNLKNTSEKDTLKALFSCGYHYSITLLSLIHI